MWVVGCVVCVWVGSRRGRGRGERGNGEIVVVWPAEGGEGKRHTEPLEQEICNQEIHGGCPGVSGGSPEG